MPFVALPPFGLGNPIITRVAANAANVVLAGLDPTRRYFIIENNSATQPMFVAFGQPASLTAGAEVFSVRIGTNGRFEWLQPNGWHTGNIQAIWAAADAAGEALLTVFSGP